MNTIDRILGESRPPEQLRQLAKARKENGTIWDDPNRPPTQKELTTPYWAYSYASYNIKGRWPEVEPVIATDSESAYLYARDVIKGRWPEAEAVIAKDPRIAQLYLNVFPKIQEDPCSTRLWWAMNGWLDWLDL